MRWNLKKRLMRLPADQIGKIENSVIKKSGCSVSTYARVLDEKSHNIKVLLALAEVLNCTLNDIINSEFKFTDPELNKYNKEKQKTLQELGLSKIKIPSK